MRGGHACRRRAPGVAIERHFDSGRRATVAAFDETDLPGEGVPALLQQDQARQRERQRHAAIAGLGERALGGGDDQIEPRLRERRGDEGAVRKKVGRRRQRDAPRGRRLGARDQALDLAIVVRKEPAELGACQLFLDRDRVGAQVDLRQVAMRDLERAPARAIDGHHLQREVGGLDLRPERAAELRAATAGEGLLAGQRERARPDAVLGVGDRGGDLGGELRSAHRPPRVGPIARQTALEIGAQERPVALRGAVQSQRPLACQAGLELRRGLVAAAVPTFEIGQHDGGTQQRMRRVGRMCFAGDPCCRRRRLGCVGEQVPEVELPGVVALARRPEGRVAEQPVDEEIAHGVAQRVANALRVVVAAEVGKIGDRHSRETLAALPDGEKALLGLVGDLLRRPCLEVDLGVRRHRDHTLALADLPVVAGEILEQDVGVVELDCGAGRITPWPTLGLHLLDRGLEPAQRGTDLRLSYQAFGPGRFVAGGAGARDQSREPFGGLRELLFVEQPVDLLPGGGDVHVRGHLGADPGGAGGDARVRRTGIGSEALAGGGDEGERTGENEGRSERGAHIGILDPAAGRSETSAATSAETGRALSVESPATQWRRRPP